MMMAALVSELHQVKPVPGGEPVKAPNEPQMAYRQQCKLEGIPVAQGVYDFLVS